MKTRKTLAKRIKVTRRGKLIRLSQSAQHLVSRKSKRTVKKSGTMLKVKKGLAKKFVKLL